MIICNQIIPTILCATVATISMAQVNVSGKVGDIKVNELYE